MSINTESILVLLNEPTYKKILDNMSSAVIWLDEHYRIRYINAAAEVTFEVSNRQAVNEPVSALKIDSENLIENLISAAESGSAVTLREAHLKLKSGLQLTADCTVTPLSGSSEEAASLLIEIQPIDRLLRLSREEHLISAQDTARTLIRGLAHEIKNPLGGIRGAAQLLERQYDDISDYTQVIIEESDRLRKLVDNMLGPNKRNADEAVNIHEVTDRIQQLITAESNEAIEIRRDYDPSIPCLHGDKEQLIQATLNIARNAMQALLEANTSKPYITFKTRVLRRFTIGDTQHRLVCALDIINNGPLIADHFKDKLFFPMVSGRAEGTGLGLSLSQSIAQRHKGLIEYNTEAENTCFTLYLPLE